MRHSVVLGVYCRPLNDTVGFRGAWGLPVAFRLTLTVDHSGVLWGFANTPGGSNAGNEPGTVQPPGDGIPAVRRRCLDRG